MTDLPDRLTARLYRINCPSPLELGEYHLNLLSASKRLVIAQHLRICPFCASEVAQLEDFLGNLGSGREPGLLQQAKVMIARLAGQAGQAATQPAVVALRGEAKGPITLEADGVMIVLEVQRAADDTITILGQLAADDQDDWTGARLELRQAGQLQSSAEVDDLGAFRFGGVTPGSKELRITSRDESVVIMSDFEVSV
ncbi:MAG: hypothetical protein ACM3QS_14620 [Bacteroidota bacterium]